MNFDAVTMLVAVPFLAFLAFTLSSSAGLGGSLILVPTMAMTLGPKVGIATAATMLALNNVGKIIAYRKDIPLRAVLLVIVMTVLGAGIGASLLIRAPEHWASTGVMAMVLSTFLIERFGPRFVSRIAAVPLAFVAGGVSGFSGTSGPMKGITIRSLVLDRQNFVAAVSAASLAGDVTKVIVFSSAFLLESQSVLIIAATVPLMVVGVLLGRRINNVIGERGYAALFWVVMMGYSVHLLVL